MDHNHTKNTRNKIYDKLGDFANIDLIKIALLPEHSGEWKIGKQGSVALSYPVFFECLRRKLESIKSEDHKIEYIDSFHRNLLGFKASHYKPSMLKSEGFNLILYIPFV